eukprot:1161529-Pelagomonas_calceolata.AAC.24
MMKDMVCARGQVGSESCSKRFGQIVMHELVDNSHAQTKSNEGEKGEGEGEEAPCLTCHHCLCSPKEEDRVGGRLRRARVHNDVHGAPAGCKQASGVHRVAADPAAYDAAPHLPAGLAQADGGAEVGAWLTWAVLVVERHAHRAYRGSNKERSLGWQNVLALKSTGPE